jgi:hypothetical protein
LSAISSIAAKRSQQLDYQAFIAIGVRTCPKAAPFDKGRRVQQ